MNVHFIPGAHIGFAVIVMAVLFRLRDEEVLLSEHFPVDYPDYKKHTRTIVPFLW